MDENSKDPPEHLRKYSDCAHFDTIFMQFRTYYRLKTECKVRGGFLIFKMAAIRIAQ